MDAIYCHPDHHQDWRISAPDGGKFFDWQSLICSPFSESLTQLKRAWPKVRPHSRNSLYPVSFYGEGNGNPPQYSCLENPMDGGAWWATVHGVARSRTWLSDFTFTFHFHALEKEIATHSSFLAWRIPGTGEPGGLPSLGWHRVGHNWSDLAAAVSFWHRNLKTQAPNPNPVNSEGSSQVQRSLQGCLRPFWYCSIV